MTDLGWKSLGVLELTALPSIDEELWVPKVREVDALLVSGGDATYLAHWMRQSGLAELLPSLRETVWVGLSAVSMVLTPSIGQDFVEWTRAADDQTLGVIDFWIFPHLDHPAAPTVAVRIGRHREPKNVLPITIQYQLCADLRQVAVDQ
jgi:dipeptidase E